MSRDLFLAHFAVEPRIAARVNDINFADSGCWIWPTSNNNYAQQWMGDRIGRVHRISQPIERLSDEHLLRTTGQGRDA